MAYIPLPVKGSLRRPSETVGDYELAIAQTIVTYHGFTFTHVQKSPETLMHHSLSCAQDKAQRSTVDPAGEAPISSATTQNDTSEHTN